MTKRSQIMEFFSVLIRGKTYLNLIYLLLAFPLGLVYFILLITGIAIGIPLVIIWVGLLVLLVVFGLWYFFIVFERKMAIWLLGVDIPPINLEEPKGKTLWQKFKSRSGNPVTWKGLVFLLAKLPIGVICFSLATTLLSLSIALLATPLYYRQYQPVIDLTWEPLPVNLHVINTLPEAMLFMLIGFFVLLISLHITNGVAFLLGKFAATMLGNKQSVGGAQDVHSLPESVSEPD